MALTAEGTLPLQKERTEKRKKMPPFGSDDDEKKPKPGTTVAERNASAWRFGGGYDRWKQGDAEREKQLPVGGIAPIRDDSQAKDYKPLKPAKKTFGQRISGK